MTSANFFTRNSNLENKKENNIQIETLNDKFQQNKSKNYESGKIRDNQRDLKTNINPNLVINHKIENENDLDKINDKKLDELINTDVSNLNSYEKDELMVREIERNSKTLDEMWKELNRESTGFQNLLINFYKNLQLLNKSFEVVNKILVENEQLVSNITCLSRQIENGFVDKLSDELDKIKSFQLKLSSFQPIIDKMCSEYSNIHQELMSCKSNNIKESNEKDELNGINIEIQTNFDDLNLRWSNLQQQLQDCYLHLYSLAENSNENIYLKLYESVKPPWQRSISSSNKIPYFIKY